MGSEHTHPPRSSASGALPGTASPESSSTPPSFRPHLQSIRTSHGKAPASHISTPTPFRPPALSPRHCRSLPAGFPFCFCFPDCLASVQPQTKSGHPPAHTPPTAPPGSLRAVLPKAFPHPRPNQPSPVLIPHAPLPPRGPRSSQQASHTPFCIFSWERQLQAGRSLVRCCPSRLHLMQTLDEQPVCISFSPADFFDK